MQSLFPSDSWQQLKDKLKETLEPKKYSSWIGPLEAAQVTEKEIVISIPNMVFYHGILTECFDEIDRCKEELGVKQCLRFETEGYAQTEEEDSIESFTPPLPDTLNNPNRVIEPSEEQEKQAFSRALSKHSSLNALYTFDSFVPGPSNQFALASCRNVAENPGQTYNPLFIYGSTGLGKTHLLHAVGNLVASKRPEALVTYLSSERFMNEMIYCLRFNRMWEFRQKYRHCDVFLVDDIQFISGKKKTTQEEFFHTFNSLYEAKKQIVITSDLFPQDIPDIEDRLRNRFQWGLIADIQPPDIEHRIAILHKKATKLNIKLPDDVAHYIANHSKRNVRELEGALHRIAAFAALQGRPVDMSLTIDTFRNVMGEPIKTVDIDSVQKVVAEHFGVRVADLKSKKRQRALTLPRQVAMFLTRKLTDASFPEIGSQFGGKDHSTVMHAVKKIEQDKLNDLDLKAHIEQLERRLEQL